MNEECHVETVRKTPSVEEMEDNTAVLLSVQGMGCENCAARVRNGLLAVYGVVAVDVSLGSGSAKVVFNPRLADVSHFERAVEQAGADGRHNYRARLIA